MLPCRETRPRSMLLPLGSSLAAFWPVSIYFFLSFSRSWGQVLYLRDLNSVCPFQQGNPSLCPQFLQLLSLVWVWISSVQRPDFSIYTSELKVGVLGLLGDGPGRIKQEMFILSAKEMDNCSSSPCSLLVFHLLSCAHSSFPGFPVGEQCSGLSLVHLSWPVGFAVMFIY